MRVHGTSRIHKGYMQNASKIHNEIYMYLKCILRGTYLRCRIHAGYMRDTCICKGDQDTCGIHAGYMRNTCGIHVSSEVIKIHAGYMRNTGKNMQNTCGLLGGY